MSALLTASGGVLAVLILTVATGFFVACEFCYVAADRTRLRAVAETGDRSAGRALRVTERLSLMLSGAQLGITVTALIVGFIAQPSIGTLIAPALRAADVPPAAAHTTSLAVSFVLATVVQMVIGELAPKNWGMTAPEAVARRLSGAALGYLRIAGPVVRVFDGAANVLIKAMGIEPAEELAGGVTADELDQIIAEAAEGGELSRGLSDLLDRALDFTDHTAGQAKVPRPEVVYVAANEPAARIVTLLVSAGHSRYPVLAPGRTDDVVGVVGVRELLDVPVHRRTGVTCGRIARPAVLVPDSLPLPAVLERLRVEREEFACVVDEYGGLAGVLTLEDIAEELVGDIADENDTARRGAIRAPDGTWVLTGGTRIDEVHRLTDLALPAGPYSTLGGLVIAALGRMPAVGDEVDVPLERSSGPATDVRLRVLEVHRRVPASVRITPAVQAPEGPA